MARAARNEATAETRRGLQRPIGLLQPSAIELRPSVSWPHEPAKRARQPSRCRVQVHIRLVLIVGVYDTASRYRRRERHEFAELRHAAQSNRVLPLHTRLERSSGRANAYTVRLYWSLSVYLCGCYAPSRYD